MCDVEETCGWNWQPGAPSSDRAPYCIRKSRCFAHAGIRRTGSGAFMDWRGSAFSAYDLRHGIITAKADAQVVMKSRDSLDEP
jgi:hypothetical protein